MPVPGTPTVAQRLIQSVDELRAAQTELEQRVHQATAAERRYRTCKAKALLQAHGNTVGEREANAELSKVDHDPETGEVLTLSDVRYLRDLAEGLRASSMEAVRGGRTIVSAVQSLANLERSEAELTRYGPEDGP